LPYPEQLGPKKTDRCEQMPLLGMHFRCHVARR